MKPVMIIGASGVFGSRLIEQIAQTRHCELILAGRDPGRAASLLMSLKARGIAARFEVFDRSKPDVATLRALAPGVIVDAAGPFQGANLAMPEAAIAAGIAYIDLADARDLVAAIPSLDAKARAAGVPVITGASSTPALSHAVLDHVTKGWRRIDRILVAIAPGNRAPRGLSVIEAILSYVGKAIPVFREGREQIARGWTLNERIDIAGAGRRHVALCETPDLDLLVSRYRPVLGAEFKAGLELGLLHHGLRLLAALYVPFLPKLARPFRTIAAAFDRFGTDTGGMLVEVTGLDADDTAVRARWSLAAAGGIGPTVPALPALALLQRIAQLKPGAYAAAGILAYDEITSQLNRLGITTSISVEHLPRQQVFERVLGPAAWAALPDITRQIHRAIPSVILEGQADIDGAEMALGRVIARVFGFPEAGQGVPVRVAIESDGVAERWARHYPTRTMRSVMTAADPSRSTVEEWMGPFRFRLRLSGSAQGIDLVPEGVSFHGLPLPFWLLPKIVATERASADGRHLFDVAVSLWPVGRLVHYRGWLKPAP